MPSDPGPARVVKGPVGEKTKPKAPEGAGKAKKSSGLHRALLSLAALLVFFTFIPNEAPAAVNVPLGSPVYRHLERLELRGLVKSALLNTRPLSRIEAARLTREARRNWEALPPGQRPPGGDTLGAIEHLEREFSAELSPARGSVYIKPVDDLSITYLYASEDPDHPDDNTNGFDYTGGSNLRASMASILGAGPVSLYLNPEFRRSESPGVKLLRGYGVATFINLELTVGRDELWWGPGRHGGLILTTNAEPFYMVKASTVRPVVLPWVFSRLGLIKPTLFITRLERERTFPRANIFGMRVELKPVPGLNIAVSRTLLFGGEGKRSLGPRDWFNMFVAADSEEHGDSPTNGDQLASVDLSYVFLNDLKFLPFRAVKLYTEWGAEDSSGTTRSPTGKANVYGVLVDAPFMLPGVDLRVEWANTARSARYGPLWYEHGVYQTGYRYKGRVVGHHMGGDSRDLFVKLRYFAPEGSVAALEYDHERSGVHSTDDTERTWYGAELYYPFNRGPAVEARIGYEDPGGVVGSLSASWSF